MAARQLLLASLFAGGLLFTGLLRLAAFETSALTPFASYATPLYIGATVLFAILLQRAGVDFKSMGFGIPFRLWHLAAAVVAVIILQAWAAFGQPQMAGIIDGLGMTGESYLDDRFGGVQGSVRELITLLAFSWTFAAIGEELAFRIVLLRGLASGLGGGALATGLALVAASVVFGLIHYYKGPAGVVSSTVSGLIFGVLVITARGAIWPAFLAHGLNNTIGILQIYDGA